MVEIKGHKKAKEKRRTHPWPGKYIPEHHENSCPYCHKHLKNIEAHVKAKHKFEKPKQIKGKFHGHD
ncbi:MAG: hypothetical protein ACPLXC_02960 [Candidatus Pacearchaeota archaeon]